MLLTLITGGISFAQTSIFQPTDVPATLLVDDPQAVEVGLKFRVTVNGTLTGVRFYKSAGNTGTHIGHLWTTANTTTPLATVTFAGESTSGWQQMLFPSPVAIVTGQTYVISYFSSNGTYSENAQFFLNAPVVNGPLRAMGFPTIVTTHERRS